MTTTSPSTKTQAWGDISDLIAQKSSAPQASSTSDLANKDVFLKLMVAQLKNQNPMNPADGVEFVTQLAQFTQLEQSMGMRQDLETIRDVLTSKTDTQTTQP
jgi:flagellar basal-body rod modification protein FlgD